MDNVWDVVVWSFWIFIWVTAIMVWFRCIWDLFSDSTVGGWGKAGWVIFLILVPWIGALVYIIVRGNSMATRTTTGIVPEEDRHAAYMRGLSAAAAAADPVSQVTQAKELLDAGALTPAEYERLKAKALA